MRAGQEHSVPAGGQSDDAISLAELKALLAGVEQAGTPGADFLTNPVPAVIYDTASLGILALNESARTLYGYSNEDASPTPRSVLDLFWGEADRLPGIAKELRESGASVGPYLHRRADGQEMVVRMSLVEYAFDNADARIAMLRRETARGLADEAFKNSDERYRELFENANDVIYLHDLQGRLLAINRAGEALSGYSREEILGQQFASLVAPEVRTLVQDMIRAHLGGSPMQHHELPLISKTGSRRYVEASTRVLYSKGQPFAIQGIGRDITERRQAQERLEQSSLALQRKNEELQAALETAREATHMKERFLANTSHELRTPMNGILGMVSLLLDTALTGTQREYAELINQCANDLLTIINDILDMSQIESGRFSLDDQPYPLRDSLQAVVRLLQPRAKSKGLVLGVEVDSAVPERLLGDAVRIRQIFTNLMANAIKFTDTGSVVVRARLANEGRDLRCEVIDSGIGVSDSARQRIFEAFVQEDSSTRRRFGGTGLGLSISKQLVEIMGGRIDCHSNTGRPGSTFWFEIPLRAVDPNEPPRTSALAN